MSMEVIQIVLTTGLFLIALLAFLLSGMKAILNASINPLKENQARMEKEITAVKSDIGTLKEDVSAIKQAVLKNTA